MGQTQRLEDMSRDELENLARQHNLDIPQSQMNKDQLMDMIKQHSSEFGEMMGKQNQNMSQMPDSAMPGHGGGQGDTPAPEGAKPEEYKNIPGNQT